MRRTRRHKFLQISVFFLIYSIIHVLSENATQIIEKEIGINTTKHLSTDKFSETESTTTPKPRSTIKKKGANATLPPCTPPAIQQLKRSRRSTNEINESKENKSTTTITTKNSNTTSSTEPISTNAITTNANTTTKDSNTTSSIEPSPKNAITSKANTTTKNSNTTSSIEPPPKNDITSKANTTTKNSNTTSSIEPPPKNDISSKANTTKNSNTTSSIEPPPKNDITSKTNTTTEKSNTTSSTEPTPPNATTTSEPPCVGRPALEQFPRPLIGPKERKRGGIILFVLVALYTFMGLAIVCDEYFVASLDRICEELKMSPDVAGATFMAAGSSAPELATVIIGVFFAKDDIGISGVIGSAVFNIMFVISVCALCTTTAIYLNWWPLIRDCFFYAVSILVMLLTIQDENIYWPESLFMLFMYVVYCVVLHYNSYLEKWAQTLPVPCKKVAPVNEQSGLVSYKTLEDEGRPPSYGCSPERPPSFEGFDNQLSGPALNQASVATSEPAQQDYYKPKEFDPSGIVDPLIKPTEGGWYAKTKWVLVFPIHYCCRKTTPDCRSERYKNWYPFTFFMSMLWISFYSYIMVWMITVIGDTLGIPDTVMGLTFVAAGVSVPDALSSMAVIKEGYGDMAVSNAVGSNVFDILICLGLPWFIKTGIINPGTSVKVISKGLTYSTLSLLSTVVFLVGATHLNGWKLDRKYGMILMAWYLIFITFASMYEMNVFGYLNPPVCTSEY